jgi:arylsulfatase A-like enzyme
MMSHLRKRLLPILLFLAVFGNVVWALWRFGGITYIRSQFSDVGKPVCPDCHIVLVTLDVCGAHNMSCYGYDRQTSPNFCSYAEENIFFENAYANGVYTLPSHASIFTGLIPSNHGVNTPNTDALSTKLPLLSDELYKHGYETLFYMPDRDIQLPVDLVYRRGMSAIYPDGYKSELYIDTAMKRLQENDRQGKKTFVSFYTNICHEPYYLGDKAPLYATEAHPDLPRTEKDIFWQFTEEFREYLLTVLPIDVNAGINSSKSAALKTFYENFSRAKTFQEAKKIYEEAVHGDTEVDLGYYNYDFFYTKKIDVNSKEQMEYLRALYDQKLFETDQIVIGKLKKYMMNSPLKDNTVVVVTSEHGQEFGEHDIFGHTTLYDLNTKVPLLLAVPNLPSRRISQNVQSADIMPTLLSLVGIAAPSPSDGINLTPYLWGKSLPDRVLVADGGFWDDPAKKTLRFGEWKLFITIGEEGIVPYELYNIKKDPLERENVLPSHFAVAKQIISRYQRAATGK